MPKRMSVSFKQFKEAKPMEDSHNGKEATVSHPVNKYQKLSWPGVCSPMWSSG